MSVLYSLVLVQVYNAGQPQESARNTKMKAIKPLRDIVRD